MQTEVRVLDCVNGTRGRRSRRPGGPCAGLTGIHLPIERTWIQKLLEEGLEWYGLSLSNLLATGSEENDDSAGQPPNALR